MPRYLINDMINTLCKNPDTYPGRKCTSKRNLLIEGAPRGQRIKRCVLPVNCNL